MRGSPIEVTNSVQLSEILLYGADGAPLEVASAANPDGTSPKNGQRAFRLHDGRNTTKWEDDSFGANGQSVVELTLADPQPVATYDFETATKHKERDPVSWRLELVHGDGTVDLLSVVHDADAPIERAAMYGGFYATTPPSPPAVPPSPPPAPPPAPPARKALTAGAAGGAAAAVAPAALGAARAAARAPATLAAAAHAVAAAAVKSAAAALAAATVLSARRALWLASGAAAAAVAAALAAAAQAAAQAATAHAAATHAAATRAAAAHAVAAAAHAVAAAAVAPAAVAAVAAARAAAAHVGRVRIPVPARPGALLRRRPARGCLALRC